MFANKEDIREKVKAIGFAFNDYMVRINDDIKWAPSTAEAESLRYKQEKRTSDLKFIHKVITHLPEALELDLICFEKKRIPGEIKKLRDEFDQFEKGPYISDLCADPKNRDALMENGLNEDDIEHMQETGYAPYHTSFYDKNIPYDITVEHMHDIKYQGNNMADNLCLLPAYLNQLKESFVRAQERILPENNQSVLIFRPKAINNHIPAIPIIPNGFRKHDDSCEELQSRVEELLRTQIDMAQLIYDPH